MTKYPQSYLGYAVNGVVVFKPKTATLTTQRKPKHGQKGQNKTKKPDCTSRELYSQGEKRDCTSQEQYHFSFSEMGDLRNACKRGDHARAFQSAFHLCEKMFSHWRNRSGRLFLEKVVRILFTPDVSNRTATYYAAHTGHSSLVHIFLSMLVISRVPPRITSSYGTNSKTIADWLKVFGFPIYFGRTSFETCILNALNQKVKNKFHQTKYSLADLAKTAKVCLHEYETWCADNNIPYIVHQERSRPYQKQSHKNRRPALVVEADDEYYNDLAGFDEAQLEADNDDCIEEADQSLESVTDLDESDLQDMIALYESMGMDDLSRQVLPSTTTNDETIPDDEWSFLTPSSSFDLLDNDSNERNPDDDCLWEVTSEVGSVLTLDSLALKESYLDMAKKGIGAGIAASTAKRNDKSPTKNGSITEQPSIQEDEPLEDEVFDAYFVMEGVKCTHGGRQKMLFKGNQKVSREEKRRIRWNRDCRLGRWE